MKDEVYERTKALDDRFFDEIGMTREDYDILMQEQMEQKMIEDELAYQEMLQDLLVPTERGLEEAWVERELLRHVY